MKACSRAIGAELRAGTPTDRVEWKEIIKALARETRRAFRRLPFPLLANVGGGALELIVKSRAGFSIDKMLATARAADPDVDQLVTELKAEIEDECRAEEANSAGVELGSGNPPGPVPGRGPGEGPTSPGADDVERPTPGLARRRN